MQESVSGTTSHVRWIRTCNEIEGSYDKIIITIVPRCTGKNITRLLPLALLHVLRICNNTDSNKLVIFSSIALYFQECFNRDRGLEVPGCWIAVMRREEQSSPTFDLQRCVSSVVHGYKQQCCSHFLHFRHDDD